MNFSEYFFINVNKTYVYKNKNKNNAPPDITGIKYRERKCYNYSLPISSQSSDLHRTAGEGGGPSYFSLPLLPTQENSKIYLQLCV